MTTTGLTAPIPTTLRRVRRIVRKLDPWTVLKVAAVFSAIAGLGLILLSIVAWTIFNNLGIPTAINEVAEKIRLIDPGESLLKSGEQYFRGAVFLSVSWMIMTAGVLTLGAVLYNLIAEIVGGLEFMVLEEVPIDLERIEDSESGRPALDIPTPNGLSSVDREGTV